MSSTDSLATWTPPLWSWKMASFFSTAPTLSISVYLCWLILGSRANPDMRHLSASWLADGSEQPSASHSTPFPHPGGLPASSRSSEANLLTANGLSSYFIALKRLSCQNYPTKCIYFLGGYFKNPWIPKVQRSLLHLWSTSLLPEKEMEPNDSKVGG